MKKRIHSTILAIAVALLGTAAIAPAQTLSPGAFNRELRNETSGLKNAAAYNRAAVVLQRALKNRNNRRFAAQYATAVANLLKRPSVVRIPLQGRAVNTAIKALTRSYFIGRPFNLNDPAFTRAYTSLVRSVALSQRTQANSNSFFRSVNAEAIRRRAPAGAAFNFVSSIGVRFSFPPPVS